MSNQPKKKYLGTRSVANRYDKKDRGWPWRVMRRDPNFPRPDIYMGGRPLWLEEALDEYDEKLRAEGR